MRPSSPLLWKIPDQETDAVYHWVPNRFDADCEASLVPLREDEEWMTVAPLALSKGTRLLVGIFPSLLQLQPRLYAAARSLNIPVLMMPPQQIKTLPYLLSQLGPLYTQGPIGCITTLNIYEPVEATLRSLEGLNIYYQLIAELGKKSPDLEGRDIFLEMHIVPSMVGLYQCTTLAQGKKTEFHPNNQLSWNFEPVISVTAPDKRFIDVILPGKVDTHNEPCACGESRRISFV